MVFSVKIFDWSNLKVHIYANGIINIRAWVDVNVLIRLKKIEEKGENPPNPIFSCSEMFSKSLFPQGGKV